MPAKESPAFNPVTEVALIIEPGADTLNCKSWLLAASARMKSPCAAARTRSFLHSPGRPPRMAASDNMTRRKRRDEIARANVCDPRDWRMEAVWFSFIITPQEITTRNCVGERLRLKRSNFITGNGVFFSQ